MADIIITPGNSEIRWYDSNITPQQLAIKSSASDTIEFWGDTVNGNLLIVTDSLTGTLTPGTTGMELGTSSLRWKPYFTATSVQGVLTIAPLATSDVPLFINAPSGQTANLITAQVNSSTKFSVDKDGDITASSLALLEGDGGGQAITLSAPTTLSANITYVLPTTSPTTGQVLSASAPSSGISTLSWADAATGSLSGSGTATQVAYWSGTSALTSSSNLYWDNTNARLSIGAGSSPGAALHLAASTAATGGIQFGSDTVLFRSAADTLRTDDVFEIIRSATSDIAFQAKHGVAATAPFVIKADGQIEWGSQGSARDTILYRAAANTLGIGTPSNSCSLLFSGGTNAHRYIRIGTDEEAHRGANFQLGYYWDSVLNYQTILGHNVYMPAGTTAKFEKIRSNTNSAAMRFSQHDQATEFFTLTGGAAPYTYVPLLRIKNSGDVSFRRTTSVQDRDVGFMRPALVSSTDATFTGRLSLYVSDYNADREALRLESDGTNVHAGLGSGASLSLATASGVPLLVANNGGSVLIGNYTADRPGIMVSGYFTGDANASSATNSGGITLRNRNSGRTVANGGDNYNYTVSLGGSTGAWLRPLAASNQALVVQQTRGWDNTGNQLLTQTGDLIQLKDNSSDTGSVLARFDYVGRHILKHTSAPADGDLANSEASFWVDNTSGAGAVKVKGKDSAGNVFSATVGAGSGGGVSSVGLSAPAQFSVSGSPVTSTGTLTLSWASQTANTILAAPNGSSGTPSFRALATADLPATVVFTNADQTLSGGNTFSGQVAFTYSPATGASANHALQVTGVPFAQATGALIEIGATEDWAGSTGDFSGNANGTYIGIIATNSYSGDFIRCQTTTGSAVTDRFRVSQTGGITTPSIITSSLPLTLVTQTSSASVLCNVNPTLSGTGNQTALQVNPTASQSGSGDYTALKINVTGADGGSGTNKLLLDAQFSSSSVFKVDKTGAVTQTGGLTLSTTATRLTLPANNASNPHIVFSASSVDITTPSQGWLWYDGSHLWIQRTSSVKLAVTKRSLLLVLGAGYIPATGADGVVLTIPHSPTDGTTALSWTVKRVYVRVETPSSGASTFSIDRSTASGAFSVANQIRNTGPTDFSISGSGTYEAGYTSIVNPSLNSGDKIRLNWTAVNGTHANFSVEILLEEQ